MPANTTLVAVKSSTLALAKFACVSTSSVPATVNVSVVLSYVKSASSSSSPSVPANTTLVAVKSSMFALASVACTLTSKFPVTLVSDCNSIVPVPAVSISKLALEAVVSILLLAILISSVFKGPPNISPFTVKLSVILTSSTLTSLTYNAFQRFAGSPKSKFTSAFGTRSLSKSALTVIASVS